MDKKATLLWIDLEMTGLDPAVDKIIEVAAIATGWDLEPIDELVFPVKVDSETIKQRMVGEFWEANATTRRELVRASEESGISTEEAEKKLLDFVNKNFDKEVILAGNSIHQDRKFIDHEWPKLSKKLHYRMLDVSAWKVVMEGRYDKVFLKPETHRALDDIKGSIKELQWYLYLGQFSKKDREEAEEEE